MYSYEFTWGHGDTASMITRLIVTFSNKRTNQRQNAHALIDWDRKPQVIVTGMTGSSADVRVRMYRIPLVHLQAITTEITQERARLLAETGDKDGQTKMVYPTSR